MLTRRHILASASLALVWPENGLPSIESISAGRKAYIRNKFSSSDAITIRNLGGVWICRANKEEYLDPTGDGYTWFKDMAGDVWVWRRPNRPFSTIADLDPNGLLPQSKVILSLSRQGEIVLNPGTYVYKDPENPTIENVVLREGARVDGEYFENVMPVDEPSGKLIGLVHNHLQISSGGRNCIEPITVGALNWPPIASPVAGLGVEVGCHFYNDFGLEATRAACGAAGWPGWYTWEWNHTNSRTYDPARRSLLGYFRGDDPRVLDWHFYWLLKYGVTCCTINPSSGVDMATWHNPSDRYHWLFQLFNNSRNFRGMRYMLFAACDTALGISGLRDYWKRSLDLMLEFPWFYTYERNGKKFPAVFLFEAEELRGALDNSASFTNTASFLAAAAARFQASGYGGICVFARHPTSEALINREALDELGVIYIAADYEAVIGERPGMTYPELTNALHTPNEARVVNVVTSKVSVPPHPSRFRLAGSSPAEFGKMLRRAMDVVSRSEHLPNLVMVYSCGEWAEGGPGLHPNAQDGFAYLQAVANSLEEFRIGNGG